MMHRDTMLKFGTLFDLAKYLFLFCFVDALYKSTFTYVYVYLSTHKSFGVRGTAGE